MSQLNRRQFLQVTTGAAAGFSAVASTASGQTRAVSIRSCSTPSTTSLTTC